MCLQHQHPDQETVVFQHPVIFLYLLLGVILKTTARKACDQLLIGVKKALWEREFYTLRQGSAVAAAVDHEPCHSLPSVYSSFFLIKVM